MSGLGSGAVVVLRAFSDADLSEVKTAFTDGPRAWTPPRGLLVAALRATGRVPKHRPQRLNSPPLDS
jgi:hypothetical protein